MARKDKHHEETPTARTYRSRGVDVEIRESKDKVELSLDGVPIDVVALQLTRSTFARESLRIQ